MRRAAIRTISALFLVLVSCTAGASATVPVSGSLVQSGGPPLQGGGTPQLYEAGVQLTFRSLRASSTFKATTGPAGVFSLSLVPGRYRVTIDGPGAKSFWEDKPMQPFPNLINVVRSHQNRFTLVISVP